MKFNYDWNVKMDFSKSMKNPNSRTMRILRYLNDHSVATKDALVYNALERKTPFGRGYSGVYFGMLRKTGLVTLTRYKNQFLYSITDLGRTFVSENAPAVEPSRPEFVRFEYPDGPWLPPKRVVHPARG